MTNEQRDELLIRLDERTKDIVKDLSNHLHHHFAVSLAAITVAIGALATAILSLLRAQ